MRLLVLPCVAILLASLTASAADAQLRAGAATSTITPPLGEEIVGGFIPFPATHVHDELLARCLVLDDGVTRLAMVVCDLLGFHRSVGDEARLLVERETGIPAGNVLVCATHTHSATNALGAGDLGGFREVERPLDPYQSFVARRIADGVRRAANLLRPAEAAWGAIEVPEHLCNRRWFMRPGTMPENPFGTADDLVKMNPPTGSPNLDRPAGPTDPLLPFLMVREPEGQPIALFAAYGLHYVGGVGPGHVSADYFGMACAELERLLGRQGQDPPFVAMLANGASGDVNNIDARRPRTPQKPYEQMRLVAHDVAARIHAAAPGLGFRRDLPLAAVSREAEIATRRPTDKQLAWARETLAKPAPAGAKKSLAAVYAGRILALDGQPASLSLPLQVLRIGEARIGTMPGETFCETGLEFRSRCGGGPAFLVSMAHGYFGYLPPPRQLDLGGYETWPGTNRLDREATPRLLEELLAMAGVEAAASPPVAKAAHGLEVDPGLVVELVAAEPDVVDPVAMQFGADGTLWVAEMGDYPTGPADGGRPLSRIRRLEDCDGDGRHETSNVFADGLPFCTGLQPWRDGLVVTLAGGVVHLRDTDGDGRCDRQDRWFEGFATENSQLRASHPVLGIDGLLSVANGLRGGTVVVVDDRWRASLPAGLDIRGRDFRFDPRGGGCEAVSGNAQFGLCFDDDGTRFFCTNRNPCIQVMLEDRDLRRQPALAVATTVQDVLPPGELSRLHPLTAGWTTSNLHTGQFSAACGIHLYRGDGLPAGYAGNAFVCEPCGNLVHRDRLRLDGVAWRAAGDDAGREFLASRDEWFRPVALADGPDGCLYVADMHRAVIEHPHFMPPELASRADLRAGDDKGRIYRIRSAAAGPDRRRPNLAAAATRDLVPLLDHPDGWHRDTAARLLLERGEPDVAAALAAMAVGGRSPAGRIRSLWLLARFGWIGGETILAASRDANPQVRATALSVAARLLPDNGPLARRLVEAADDSDARVRMAAAVRLGDVAPQADDPAAAALVSLLLAAPEDRWLRAAVLSSSRGRSVDMLVRFLAAEATFDTAAVAETAGAMAAVAGGAEAEALEPLAAAIAALPAGGSLSLATLEGLCLGLERRGLTLDGMMQRWPAADRAAIHGIVAAAVALVGEGTAAADRRVTAIRLLRHAAPAVAVPALLPLASAATDQAVRLAAIEAIQRFDEPRVADLLCGDALLGDAGRQTPAIRRAILDACCGRPALAARLLDAVEGGDVAATCLGPEHWKLLERLADAGLRERAERLRKASVPEDRARVIEAYAAALAMRGDPSRGREVFARTCAGCHRVDGVGVNVAPDISDSRLKRPEQYLVDILDPNRAIDSASFACTVLLDDGRSFTGIVAAENGGSITLRQAEGASVTLLRDQIEEVSTSSVSLMPVGLERSVSVPQMADLIAFLKGWRQRP